MPTVYTVPDVLNDVRYWLRRQADLAAVHAGRVFFRIPDNQASFPLMRIYRTGGGMRQTGGGAPISDVLISIECWSNLERLYGTVRQLAQVTEAALWSLPSGMQINPAGLTVVIDAMVLNVIDSPDPDTGWPRIVCDTRWSVIAANSGHAQVYFDGSSTDT
jgi:hypothetical protein